MTNDSKMRQMRQMRPDLETVAEGLVNLFRHFLAELSGAKIPLIHPTSRYIFKLWSGPTACSTMFFISGNEGDSPALGLRRRGHVPRRRPAQEVLHVERRPQL